MHVIIKTKKELQFKRSLFINTKGFISESKAAVTIIVQYILLHIL